MRNKHAIILDCHYLCHRSKYKAPLSYDNQETEIIFGFLYDILTLSTKFDTDQFIFAWDSRKSHRKNMAPDYKAQDVDSWTPEEIKLETIARRQFVLLRDEIIPKMGFKNNIMLPGYEADDIIASVVKNNPGHFIVVSRDNDLYQLLDYCSMYDPTNKKIYGRDHFIKEYRIEPEQWASVKAIAGCPGDHVIGIKNIGKVKACQYLRGELKPHSKALESILNSKEIIERNWPLVKLPLAGTPAISVYDENYMNYKNFLEICIDYGLKTFVTTHADKWRSAFFQRKEDN